MRTTALLVRVYGGLLLGVCWWSPARAQTPPAPPPSSVPATPEVNPRAITAEVPIVAGNAASAKQRALEDAFRQAVERSFGPLVAETGLVPTGPLPPGLNQLRSTFYSRGKRYMRSYRILEQGENAGRYRIQIDAEVDEGLLRRDIDRARGVSSTMPTRGTAAAAVILAGAPSDAVVALARALDAAGIKAETPALGSINEAKAKEAAVQAHAAGALLLSGTITAEGAVRGTTKVAAACNFTARVLPVNGGANADRSAEAHAFADSDETAHADCVARAVGDLAKQVVTSFPAAATPGPDVRIVTLDLDLIEPAALPLVLQALRKVGSVASAEVRRVTVGHVEVRASSRLGATGLAAAIARELNGSAAVTPGQAVADRIAVQIRLAENLSPTTPPTPTANP